MDIVFDCPKCGQELVVDDSYAGEQIECPECSSEIVVPAQSKQDGASAEEKPATVSGGVINAMASSAAAREKKTFTVPVHNKAVKETLIQKPQAPLNVAAKKWENGVAIRTIRRIDCMEVGKDHFDERVTEFINTVGYDHILNVQPISYTTQDLATKALMTDFGVMIFYRLK